MSPFSLRTTKCSRGTPNSSTKQDYQRNNGSFSVAGRAKVTTQDFNFILEISEGHDSHQRQNQKVLNTIQYNEVSYNCERATKSGKDVTAFQSVAKCTSSALKFVYLYKAVTTPSNGITRLQRLNSHPLQLQFAKSLVYFEVC